MATIYVTYHGTAETPFDRSYYVDEHIPLVLRAWQRHGLLSADAFFPHSQSAGTIAICECRFRDDVAVDACFGAAETADVMADVARFTDVEPVRVRATTM